MKAITINKNRVVFSLLLFVITLSKCLFIMFNMALSRVENFIWAIAACALFAAGLELHAGFSDSEKQTSKRAVGAFCAFFVSLYCFSINVLTLDMLVFVSALFACLCLSKKAVLIPVSVVLAAVIGHFYVQAALPLTLVLPSIYFSAPDVSFKQAKNHEKIIMIVSAAAAMLLTGHNIYLFRYNYALEMMSGFVYIALFAVAVLAFLAFAVYDLHKNKCFARFIGCFITVIGAAANSVLGKEKIVMGILALTTAVICMVNDGMFTRPKNKPAYVNKNK